MGCPQVNTLILAQTLGIKTLAWSGTGIVVEGGAEQEDCHVPKEVSHIAVLTSLQNAETMAKTVGYPVEILPADTGETSNP